MMLKSIERLRESLKDCTSEAGVEPNRFDTYWITARACDMLVDEIEAEIAERYMELPLDADGVPIRPGDKLVDMDGLVFEVEMISQDDMQVFKDGSYDEFDNFEFFKHYKPRTVEDVLADFRFEANLIYADQHIGGEDRADKLHELDARCAAEIRDLMGGDKR